MFHPSSVRSAYRSCDSCGLKPALRSLVTAAICVIFGGIAAGQSPEPAALRFARRDAAELRQRLQPQIDEGQARLNLLSAARQTLDAVEASLKQVQEKLPATDQAAAVATTQAQSAQAAFDSQTAADPNDSKGLYLLERVLSAARASESAAKQSAAELKEALATTTAAKDIAAAKLKEVETAGMLAGEGRAKLEKSLADWQSQLARADARVVAFEKTPPVANPAAIREAAVFKLDRPAIACRIDPEARFLYAGAERNSMQRWQLSDSSAVPLEGHKSWVRYLNLHPDGRTLLSGSYEGKLLWWDGAADQPAPLRTIDAHRGYLRALSISPDGQWVATSGNDKFVRIWNAADGSLVKELPGHESHVYNVMFHPSGKFVFSGDLMGVVKQWDATAWTHVRDLDAAPLHKYDEVFKAHCGGIRGMDFSPDGRLLACGGIGEVTNAFAGVGVPTVAIFDCETGSRLRIQKPANNFQGTCWSVRFHPSGEFLVGGGGAGSGSLWFWKPGEEKSFADFKLPTNAYDVWWHPDGLHLAVALYDNTVRLYDLGPKVEVAGK